MKQEISYPECCKECEHQPSFPDKGPCRECWLVGKEPVYEQKKHKKHKK